ncbi:MAG: hypothetical protein SNF33_05425 [Candidatus Algichlamydia australiensis]|nr:hypothetical protein [Chlamydiales bacterium]
MKTELAYTIATPTDQSPHTISKESMGVLAISLLAASCLIYNSLLSENYSDPTTGLLLLLGAKVLTMAAFSQIPVNKIVQKVLGKKSTTIATFAYKSESDYWKDLPRAAFRETKEPVLSERNRLRTSILANRDKIKRLVQEQVQSIPPEPDYGWQGEIFETLPYLFAIGAFVAGVVCHQQSLSHLETFKDALVHVGNKQLWGLLNSSVAELIARITNLTYDPLNSEFYQLADFSDFYDPKTLTSKEKKHYIKLLTRTIRDLKEELESFEPQQEAAVLPSSFKKESNPYKTTAAVAVGGASLSYLYFSSDLSTSAFACELIQRNLFGKIKRAHSKLLFTHMGALKNAVM